MREVENVSNITCMGSSFQGSHNVAQEAQKAKDIPILFWSSRCITRLCQTCFAGKQQVKLHRIHEPLPVRGNINNGDAIERWHIRQPGWPFVSFEPVANCCHGIFCKAVPLQWYPISQSNQTMARGTNWVQCLPHRLARINLIGHHPMTSYISQIDLFQQSMSKAAEPFWEGYPGDSS